MDLFYVLTKFGSKAVVCPLSYVDFDNNDEEMELNDYLDRAVSSFFGNVFD